MTETRPRVPLQAVSGLGLATLIAYGSWFYAFGVLVEAIARDTGWSLTALGATYSGATLLVGAFAAVAGRVLDRFGPTPPLVVGGAIGGGLLLAAADAGGPLAFGALYGLGGGLVGALGFYHVTMAAAARLADGPAGTRAVALLTIWGAFASPLFLPLTAWLVEHHGWRATQRILAALVVAGFVVAAGMVRGVGPTVHAEGATHPIAALKEAARSPVIRRALLAEVVAALGIGALLVYQVPVMTAAGLSLTTAASLAGARGLLQLLGRLPLSPIVDRFGVRPSLVACFALVGLSGALLGLSSSIAVAVLYAVVAGAALGAMSPLSGLFSKELFDAEHLGLLMGAKATVRQLFWALGPFVTGALIDATGGTEAAVWLVVVTGGVSAVLLARVPHEPGRSPG